MSLSPRPLRRSRSHSRGPLLEALEGRALLSADAGLGFANGNSFGNHHGESRHASVTPITDLTGAPVSISAVTGVAFSGDVATLTSATTPINLRGYKATIDWGDGTSTTRGFIRVTRDNVIHILGFHRYSAQGSFSVTVTLTQYSRGVASTPLQIVSSATVAQNSATGVTITPTTNTPFTGPVGTFSLPAGDTLTDPASFKVRISWGDGTGDIGTVTDNGDGTFSVSGTHTYTLAGDYRIRIFVFQQTKLESDGTYGGRPSFIASILSTATVTDPTAPVTTTTDPTPTPTV